MKNVDTSSHGINEAPSCGVWKTGIPAFWTFCLDLQHYPTHHLHCATSQKTV